jgi:glucuronate isomerase
MSTSQILHPDRLFSPIASVRQVARELYQGVQHLPIISPHGHTDPAWFADNLPFSNPAELLIQPDHYVFRMLYSQGVSLESLGIGQSGSALEADPRNVWRIFAHYYYLFQGTPSRLWMDFVLHDVFGITEVLNNDTADSIYDIINTKLALPEYRPRQLFERFNIEVIATTEHPLDNLAHHKKIQNSAWQGRVITAFRPDNVLDPEFIGFANNIQQLGELTNCDTQDYTKYLEALKIRRQYFIAHGATSSDHGHVSACTADLSDLNARALFAKAMTGTITSDEAEIFRGHMLTQMAQMSIEDGLVMQLHAGCYRNHNPQVLTQFGRDKGADLPLPNEFVHNLKPLLDKFGNSTDLSLILFTLDETTYSRELAPLAGHYPALKLGPAWWFHDSPEGMKRFRQQTMETAGFYNTVGFNDDTRAFLSIPARHDVARRVDCNFLAELICEHRITETQGHELAYDLSYRLAKEAYRL